MSQSAKIWRYKASRKAIAMIALLLSPDLHSADGNQQREPAFHIVPSAASGQNYRLWIFQPNNYSPEKSPPIPAVYALTLQSKDIPSTAEKYYQTVSRGEVADYLLVAVGFESDLEHDGLRSAQSTPTPNPSYDTQHLKSIKENWPEETTIDEEMKKRWRSGQAQLLSDAISDTIIPFVENHYNTSHDRSLLGHSLGGLFVTNFMLEKPNLFKKYWIVSPSYWWDGADLFLKEIEYANNFDDLDAKIYFSAGGLESEQMIVQLDIFTKLLKSRKYPNLEIKHEVIEGEDHMSIIEPSGHNGMKYLLPKIPEP